MVDDSVGYIHVQGRKTGLIGLERDLREAAARALAPAKAAAVLLEDLKPLNYIPPAMEGEYLAALEQAYRRIVGLPCTEPAPGLAVVVLGAACPACAGMFSAAVEALAELGMEAGIEHVTDPEVIASHGPVMVPALVVDGQALLQGRPARSGEVKRLLEAYLRDRSLV